MAERIIFHIDVNSAFLSWTAAYRCSVLGESFDLRDVPSVIAGQKDSRRSIVLAKSTPAKKFGIRTGEPLGMARDKCPDLVVAEPDYDLYISASRAMMSLLRNISPVVEQFSIDEAWVDMTGTQRLYGSPVFAAQWLKERIKQELGFTVNIGISSNKMLAKMAGELEKPDKVLTLFPWEMEEKLWQAFIKKESAIDEVLSSEGIYTEELKQRCLSVYRVHQPNIHLYDNARELLQQFLADGYKLGLITDGRPEGQRAKIKALGLAELMDYIIVTDELGGVEYRKPNKDAFVKMRETLGVTFEEMCYIGDNLKKDFIAPEILGIRAIHFANTDGLYRNK